MKTAVLSNFDGDEFSYQYLNLDTMNSDTNELHEKLEYYCNTKKLYTFRESLPNK